MQPTQRQLSTIILLLGMWAGIQPAKAQYTANYQTNTISGVATYWAGDYVVGSNTFADALLIRNAGVLTNANGYLGYLPASSSNFVMVTGAGSVWSNAMLYLGNSGGGNTMIISNAGYVVSRFSASVAGNATSSSNHILVTGTNSIWNPGGLNLGNSGSGNNLVISNGGQLVSLDSFVGYGAGSCDNSALVSGAGTVWSNNGNYLDIGHSGSRNKMIINAGGRVRCSQFANIGLEGTSSNNLVWVSDTNSLWDVSSEAMELMVGWFGSGNSIIVTNGGQFKGYYAYLGRDVCGNNAALVTGPGSSFSVNCYIYTGNRGHDNSFTVANGAAVTDKFCYISYGAGSSNNSVLITGTNSSWQNSYSVFVGYSGVNGSLTISNGAMMSYINTVWTPNHSSILGYESTSSNNRALVTGGGSIWDCSGDMYVGVDGPGNSLVISNGGQVVNNYGWVGRNPGSDNNRVLVVGTNSVWTNNVDLYVGCYSAGNSLVISNGGRVSGSWGLVGYAASSFYNQALITGAGSVWSNAATVCVGDFGVSNSLVITNGGRINDEMGIIGFDTNSFNNQALVTGTGSVWSNATLVFVGNSGSGNSLTIRDGGLVADYWGVLGEDYSSSDNMMSVESGGIWRNHELLVGDGGSHNALFVDGGSVFATNMTVGYASDYDNNLVELDSGQIVVTNQAHSAVLEVYGGSFLLAGGTLRVDTLIVTNDGAQFMHIGGTLIYRILQLNPDFDADVDGIPNGWEQAHGLDPLNPDDAEADSDHDGMSNLQEYLAGTNPTNAASCFEITSLALTNGNVRVRWSAVGGKHYVVQTNSGLGTAFSDASPVIAMPGSSEMVTNYLDQGAATNNRVHFYRVRIAP